jgi:hypothetical protein
MTTPSSTTIITSPMRRAAKTEKPSARERTSTIATRSRSRERVSSSKSQRRSNSLSVNERETSRRSTRTSRSSELSASSNKSPKDRSRTPRTAHHKSTSPRPTTPLGRSLSPKPSKGLPRGEVRTPPSHTRIRTLRKPEGGRSRDDVRDQTRQRAKHAIELLQEIEIPSREDLDIPCKVKGRTTPEGDRPRERGPKQKRRRSLSDSKLNNNEKDSKSVFTTRSDRRNESRSSKRQVAKEKSPELLLRRAKSERLSSGSGRPLVILTADVVQPLTSQNASWGTTGRGRLTDHAVRSEPSSCTNVSRGLTLHSRSSLLLSRKRNNKSVDPRDSLLRAGSERIVSRSTRKEEHCQELPKEVQFHADSRALLARTSSKTSRGEEKEDRRMDLRKAFSERLNGDVMSTDNRGSHFSRHRRSGSEDLQKSGALAMVVRGSTRDDHLRKSQSEQEKKVRNEGFGKLSLHGLGERSRLGGFFRSQSERFFRKQIESEMRGNSGMGSQPGRILKKRSGSDMKHSSTDGHLPDGIPEFISFDSSECPLPSPYKSQDDNDELRALNERLAKLKLPMPDYRESDHHIIEDTSRKHFQLQRGLLSTATRNKVKANRLLSH